MAVAVSTTNNPLLLLLALAVAALVVAARRGSSPWARAFRLYLWLGLFIIVVRVVLHVLVGLKFGEIVLFTLPEVPLPRGRPASSSEARSTSKGCSGPRARPAARGDDRLRRRRQRPGQPQAAAAVAAAGALRDRHGPRGRGDGRPAARRQRAAGAPGPPAARGHHARLRSVPCGRRCRCSRTPSSARCCSPRRWTPAATAGPGAAPRSQRRLTGALMLAGLLGICVGIYGVLDTTTPALLGLPRCSLGLALSVAGPVARRPPRRAQPLPARPVARAGVAHASVRCGRRRRARHLSRTDAAVPRDAACRRWRSRRSPSPPSSACWSARCRPTSPPEPPRPGVPGAATRCPRGGAGPWLTPSRCRGCR